MDMASLVEMKRNPKIPALAPGDTVKVSARIVEGGKERIQVFQGVVIKVRGGGAGASFTVRHVAYGIGVERTFLLHSPLVEKVEVVRHGKVRRARLYYLRGLSGKEARRKIKRVDRKVEKLGEEVLAPEPEEVVEPLLETEEAEVVEGEPVQEEAKAAEPVPEPEPVPEEPTLEKEPEPEPIAEPEQPQAEVVAEVPEEKTEPEPVLEKEPEAEAVLEPEEDQEKETT